MRRTGLRLPNPLLLPVKINELALDGDDDIFVKTELNLVDSNSDLSDFAPRQKNSGQCLSLARTNCPLQVESEDTIASQVLVNAVTGQVICADVAGDGHNFAWQWPRLFLDTDARGGDTCTEGQIETGHILSMSHLC